MSYARFSCDDYRSDVYAYMESGGAYVIHVASSRYQPDVPLPPAVPLSEETLDEWLSRFAAVSRIIDQSPRVPIGLPHDGAHFVLTSARECLERLLELRAIGYHVPQRALELLERDAAVESAATSAGDS